MSRMTAFFALPLPARWGAILDAGVVHRAQVGEICAVRPAPAPVPISLSTMRHALAALPGVRGRTAAG